MKTKIFLSLVLACALSGTAFASLPDTSALADTAKEKAVETVKEEAVEVVKKKVTEAVTKKAQEAAEESAKDSLTKTLTGK